jgi:hypothetical protein
MSYNGSGTFNINTSGQPVVAGTVITASAFNALTADLATGLTTAITKDGQTATTAQIPFAAGLRSTLTTDSTTSTSGSIITDGGLGVAKAITAGTTITGTKLIPTGTSVTGNGMYLPAANTLGFSTNGTNAVNIDASQNVGVGVTPSAWTLGKALEIGYVGHGIWGNATNETILMTNAYYNSAWKYSANSQYATQYAQRDGQHIFYNAPQGGGSAIGTNITFTQAMTLDAAGSLLVGTTSNSNSVRFKVAADGTNVNSEFYQPASTSYTSIIFTNPSGTAGSITTNALTTTYTTTSDYRLKENVAPMVGALNTIAQLKPVTYKWKVDGSDGQGFIAHELQSVVPNCVTGEKDAVETRQYEISPAVPATFDEDGNELTPAVEAVMGEREVPKYQGIDTSFLVATLTAAIQELNAKFEEYKAAHP